MNPDHEVFEDPVIVNRYRRAIPDAGITYQDRVLHHVLGQTHQRGRQSSWWRPGWASAAILVAAVLAAGTAFAFVNLANLGAPTSDVPQPSASLDGFRAGAPDLHIQRKAEVLVFESLWDGGSALERWPLIKALGQFGTWTGLKAGTTTEPMFPPHRAASGALVPAWPEFPTFDLTQARYRSPYVVLVDRVMQVYSQGPVRSLSAAEGALLARYRRLPTAVSIMGGDARPRPVPYPVIVIGGYGERGPFEDPAFVIGATTGQGPTAWQTFESLRKQFQLGDAAPGTGWIVREFNTTTNMMTALICHADGMQPGRVCHRPNIEAIVRQLH